MLTPTSIALAQDSLAIGTGAVLGALARYKVGTTATEYLSKQKNSSLSKYQGWHTAGINILGSFTLGFISGTPTIYDNIIAKSGISQTPPSAAAPSTSVGLTPRMKLMSGVGFCGSFTTFSTYSVDIVNMFYKGEILRGITYAGVNNVGGVMAAWGGLVLARKIYNGVVKLK